MTASSYPPGAALPSIGSAAAPPHSSAVLAVRLLFSIRPYMNRGTQMQTAKSAARMHPVSIPG